MAFLQLTYLVANAGPPPLDAPVTLVNLLTDKDLLRVPAIVEGVRNTPVQCLLAALER